jgi:hypothetical protein
MALITLIVTYTRPILTIYQDHFEKHHLKKGHISRETVAAVKQLKSDSKDSTLEAKYAERWSCTYRYLFNLSSTDEIPSPCKLSGLDLVYQCLITDDSSRLSEAGGMLSKALAASYTWT